ncbi:MAG TPA: hypothetical protein VIW94_10155 [Acidimicrobiia bacterium]
MLAALNVTAVGLGLAGGGLVATIVALGLGGLLSVMDVDDGANLGLLVGIVVGLVFGGWVAGRGAVHSNWFHGSIVGLALAAVIIALASFAEAKISILTVIWMAFLSSLIAGLGGFLGGRSRTQAS